MKLKCASCGKPFNGQRSTAKYCSATCRQRARRERNTEAVAAPPKGKTAARKKPATRSRPRPPATKKAAASRAAKKASAGKPSKPARDSSLVQSVQAELERANAVDSFAGQLALQLARRLSSPAETGISSLSKELRTVMDTALGVSAPRPAEEEEDELDKARKAREQKARAAAR